MSQRPNRSRGVVLTQAGSERLEAAITAAQQREKGGQRFTPAELEMRANFALSSKTIRKIRDHTVPVDIRSVQALFNAFNAFGLQLEPSDYSQPPTPKIRPEDPNRPLNPKIDWGEKPDTALFFGRATELTTINQWVQGDQCRLITLLGLGGIGKTSLAAKLANQVYDRFDYVIWRSLREAPPLDEILVRLIQFLSDQQETEINLPTRLGERIIRLLHYLRAHRCLVVLDNLESILQAETAGHYRDGYEGYSELIQRIGSTEHQSCLLLTSRECPRELAPMAGNNLPVRLWPVGGIDTKAGRELLRTKDLELDEANAQGDELIRRYSGNPQALHLVATAIQKEFFGDVNDFLHEYGTVVDDVCSLLDQHLSRLAPLERSILFWLAINREPVGLDELVEDLLPPVTKQEVRGALRGLSDRYLVETVGKQFTLQNVIMEFAIDQFVELICNEVRNQSFDLFRTHALIKATAKDYVRETQIRLILNSIAVRISNQEQEIISSLKQIRQHVTRSHGYAPGNSLNLLFYFEKDLDSLDFSSLEIVQADFSVKEIYNLNFSRSTFNKCKFRHFFNGALTVRFSSDGKSLITGDIDGNIRFIELSSGQNIKLLSGHADWVYSISISPDEIYLASAGDDQSIRLWEIASDQCLHVFQGHTGWVWCVCFSPDGHYLVSGSFDSTIRVWDIKKRKCVRIFYGHEGPITSLFFVDNGDHLASTSHDGTFRIWNFYSLELVSLLGEQNKVNSAILHPKGDVFIAREDGKIEVWNCQKPQRINTIETNKPGFFLSAFSPRGDFFAGCLNQNLLVWKTCDFQLLHLVEAHNADVNRLSFNPENDTLASCSQDGIVRVWEAATGKCVNRFQGYVNHAYSVSFSADGCLLTSAHSDNKVRLWNLEGENLINSFEGHKNWVWSASISPKSDFLASGGDDHTLMLWDASTGKCIYKWRDHYHLRCVKFSPCGLLLAAGDEHSIKIYDTRNRSKMLDLKDHSKRIESIDFNPDGDIIASGSFDNTVKIWDIKTGLCIRSLEGHSGAVCAVKFSSDGEVLASCSYDKSIKINHVKSGKLICDIDNAHDERVTSVCFCLNNTVIASSGFDRLIKLWDSQTGALVKSLEDPGIGIIRSIAFSEEKSVLASCGQDENIRVWNLEQTYPIKKLNVRRPYEGTNITGAHGITQAQRVSLIALGAIDE